MVCHFERTLRPSRADYGRQVYWRELLDFNGTPELDMSVDIYPNNAWINGRVDDIRFIIVCCQRMRCLLSTPQQIERALQCRQI
jgi:hypothetical protein